MAIASLLEKLKRWAAAQSDVVGVALVGGYARESASQESDVDVMVLTTEVGKYFRDKQWVLLFGEAEKTAVEQWGRVETLRAFYTDGNEIEFNFSTPDWTNIPVDLALIKSFLMGCRFSSTRKVSSSHSARSVRRTIVEAS